MFAASHFAKQLCKCQRFILRIRHFDHTCSAAFYLSLQFELVIDEDISYGKANFGAAVAWLVNQTNLMVKKILADEGIPAEYRASATSKEEIWTASWALEPFNCSPTGTLDDMRNLIGQIEEYKGK
jgi:hypothetical protein